jgi:L,D-transpeptidase catalytic domain
MNVNRRRFLGAVAAGTAGLVAPRAFAAVRADDPPALLSRAMAAMQTHSRSIAQRDIIGLVDFSAPSRAERFQLVDIANGRVLSAMLVAHGRGSDPANSGWVERFSNRHGSNASSSGAFLTGDTYHGKHGRSRKLVGLDAENNQALSRGIVIHAASYVDGHTARTQGRIGRSQGCFAVSNADINALLARLGSGRLLFASKQASSFASRQFPQHDG